MPHDPDSRAPRRPPRGRRPGRRSYFVTLEQRYREKLLPEAPFDGRSLRSRTQAHILALLALGCAGPISAAELWRFLYIAGQSRSLGRTLRAMEEPDFFYQYLARLADRAWLKAEKLQGRLQLLITPRGRRALEEYERHWAARGQSLEPDVQALLAEWKRRPAANDEKARLAASIEQAAARTGRRRKRGRPSWRERLADLLRKYPAPKRLPGQHRENAFVAYDVPIADRRKGFLFPRILRVWGFRRLQQSLWIGPTARLRGVAETLEQWGLVPYAKWGTITVLSS